MILLVIKLREEMKSAKALAHIPGLIFDGEGWAEVECISFTILSEQIDAWTKNGTITIPNEVWQSPWLTAIIRY